MLSACAVVPTPGAPDHAPAPPRASPPPSRPVPPVAPAPLPKPTTAAASGVQPGPPVASFRISPDAARAALVPIVRELALAASRADIHFTIDAEEAERLELSLDVIEALVADDALFSNGWQGFGLALQAFVDPCHRHAERGQLVVRGAQRLIETGHQVAPAGAGQFDELELLLLV